MLQPAAYILSMCIRPDKRRLLAIVRLDLHFDAVESTLAREPGDDFTAFGDHCLRGREVHLTALIAHLGNAVGRSRDIRYLERGLDAFPTRLHHVELGLALVLDPVAASIGEVLTPATAAGLPDGSGSDLVTACDVISRATVKGDLDRAWDADGQKLADAVLNPEAL